MAQITTAFAIGDEVTFEGTRGRFTIKSVLLGEDGEEYKVEHNESRIPFWRRAESLTLAPPKLSHIEAILEAGRIIQQGVGSLFYTGSEEAREAIRARCYPVLGGAGVLDDYRGRDRHNVMRGYLNAAIERAEKGQ